MGYLYWGVRDNILILILWWLIVSIPCFITFSKTISSMISLYGLASMMFSYLYTDSAGSNWCFYTSFTNIICILYYFRMIMITK
jgi:uncharacterized membrane protein